jgi:uncharacterized integral membrane protein
LNVTSYVHLGEPAGFPIFLSKICGTGLFLLQTAAICFISAGQLKDVFFRGENMKTKLLAFILFLTPVLIYVWENNTPVSIRFVRWEYAVPQALLVLSTLLVGIILGLLLCYSWKNRKANQQKKAEKQAKKQKKNEEKLKKKQEKQEKKQQGREEKTNEAESQKDEAAEKTVVTPSPE